MGSYYTRNDFLVKFLCGMDYGKVGFMIADGRIGFVLIVYLKKTVKGDKMRNLKIAKMMLSLMLMFGLTTASFAMGPGDGKKAPKDNGKVKVEQKYDKKDVKKDTKKETNVAKKDQKKKEGKKDFAKKNDKKSKFAKNKNGKKGKEFAKKRYGKNGKNFAKKGHNKNFKFAKKNGYHKKHFAKKGHNRHFAKRYNKCRCY